MGHQFSQVPKADIPRSSFDRSSSYKTTFDAGLLIPVYQDEVLPGDTFNMKMTAFARLATPIKPIMDNMRMTSFWFFVPHRLVWDNWHKFNGAQDIPGDSTDFLLPQIVSDVAGYAENSIYDYLGLPVGITATFNHSAMPLRSINLIWNEWFRDQNLQNPVTEHKDDGPDPHTDYALLSRGKRHDYFTSCLPWPQKSDNPVLLPLGESAPIAHDTPLLGNVSVFSTTEDDYRLMGSANPVVDAVANQGSEATSLYADLSDATAATINELRQAFQIQRLFERDARGGTRLTEIIRSHFGVTPPDARLQRPEFLGSGTSPVVINPVAQTTDSLDVAGGDTPQGNLAAVGTVVLKNHGFTKSFTEHGTIIGFVSVQADLTYQNNLQRGWSRQTRFDFFWPALSHLGEMAVLSKEIFVDGTAADEDVFGYQEAYADYRYRPSLITGAFRSQSPTSLDIWHLAQEFATRPVLGDQFITDTPPLDRVIAVPDEPHFLFDSIMSLRCARPMPLYGVPGMIDHF